MTKLRLIFHCIVDYEPNKDCYAENATADEMLAIDLENALDDPMLTIGESEIMVTGEVIEP